jgi:hypothetical protein
VPQCTWALNEWELLGIPPNHGFKESIEIEEQEEVYQILIK